MRELLGRVNNLPLAPVIVLSLFLLAGIGIADYLTGHEFSICIFYLVPISLIVIRMGAPAGIAFSVLSAVVILISDQMDEHTVSSWVSPYWNAGIRLGYFIIHSYFLGALMKMLDAEYKYARFDSLTGASNARHFEEYANNEISRARRSGKPLTVAYVDFDNFKSVNDNWGHKAGDELLKMSAASMQKDVRATDMVARMGGDEFIVIFPETGFEDSSAIVKRMRKNLQDAIGEKRWPVTMSVGAVTFYTPPATVDAMIAEADKLMYIVKSNGKNDIRHEKQESARV
jgi:diguanylate cyclase (GGDEF)-like protein